jgi:hypothetical protein
VDKTFIQIPVEHATSVDFAQTGMTSLSSSPHSVDGGHFIVKYSGDMPSSIVDIPNRGEPMDYSTAMSLLNTAQWQEVI